MDLNYDAQELAFRDEVRAWIAAHSASTIATRSSRVKAVPRPRLLTEAATATVTRGKSLRVRLMTSMWPRVTGSKVPGTTTWSMRAAPVSLRIAAITLSPTRSLTITD